MPKQLVKIDEYKVREFEEVTIPEEIIPEHTEVVMDIMYTLNNLDDEITAIQIQIDQWTAERDEAITKISEYQTVKDERVAKRAEVEALGVIKEVEPPVEK
jgi:hypothetical protein